MSQSARVSIALQELAAGINDVLREVAGEEIA